MMKVLTRYAMLLVFLLPQDLIAKVHHVQIWGVDAQPCSRKSPCESIQFAIVNAGPNDKIMVGPGHYVENLVVDKNLSMESLTGLFLESEVGRHGTRIESMSGDSTLVVNQARVRIGKAGKGFTFTGATDTDSAGILIDVAASFPRIKIEGNQFGLPRTTALAADSGFDNFSGLRIIRGGDKIQIRKNIFQNSASSGIECTGCFQALIRNNRSNSNAESGMVFQYQPGAEAKDAKMIRQNFASRNGASGMYVESNGDTLTKWYAQLHDNVLEHNAASGVLVGPSHNGVLFDANIMFANGASGLSAPENTNVAIHIPFRNNLFAENGLHGFDAGDIDVITALGNTAIGNGGNGFDFNDIDSSIIGYIWQNNFLGNAGCGIDSPVLPFDSRFRPYRKLYFNDNAGGDQCGFELDEGKVDKPNPIRVKRASRVIGG